MQPREPRGSIPSPLRLLDTGKDGTRRISEAVREAASGTKCVRSRAGLVTAGSRVLGVSAGPADPPGRRQMGRRPPVPGRPQLPALRAPRTGGHTDTHPHTDTPRHTQTHRRTRTKHTHSHLLDVLPDGGAVVADDEQLQGVIDEAVLQGRRRPWHGQAPGGSGAPSPAPQRPTPPFPSPRREATPPKHHLSPLETKGRGPASRFPSGFSPFPPTAGPAPGRADAPRPRAVRAARGAHHGAGGAAAAASRGWARLPHHLPRPPPPRAASAGSQ